VPTKRGDASGATGGQPTSEAKLEGLATVAATLFLWRWADPDLTGEENRIMPRLLLGLYLGRPRGGHFNKTEAAELMGLEPGKTAAKYIRLAKQRGWIMIDRSQGRGGRAQDILRPTQALITLVEQQLATILGVLGGKGIRFEQGPPPGTTSRMMDQQQPAAMTASSGVEHVETRQQKERPKTAVPGGQTRFVVLRPTAGDLGPYARKAADLVDAFHGSSAIRMELLEQLKNNIALSGRFDFHGGTCTSTIASLNWPLRVVAGSANVKSLADVVRSLFLSNADTVQIIPGTHHYGFADREHPDDLQTAHSVTSLFTSLLKPTYQRPVPGLFPADDLDGTLILLGGATSNAVTRLVLEYKRIDDVTGGFERVPEPVINLMCVPQADPNHAMLRITPEEEEPNWALVDGATGDVFRSEIDENGRPVTDHLTVIVLPNFLTEKSFKRGAKLVIFAGMHGVGTKASALLLQDYELLDLLQRSAIGAPAWRAIIKVNKIKHSSAKERPEPVSLDRTVHFRTLAISDHLHEEFINKFKQETHIPRAKRGRKIRNDGYKKG